MDAEMSGLPARFLIGPDQTSRAFHDRNALDTGNG